MEKVKKVNYRCKNGYDYKKTLPDFSKDNDYNLKVTEPGQAISVRKLVERYEKGQRATRLPSEI